MSKGALVFWGVILILVVAGIGLSFFVDAGPGNLDGFAQCLKDKGAIFYGAFWCPHCQKQKALFGRSASLLPYEECSTPDGKEQLQVCKDKEIQSYPTWDFADGSRANGEQTPAQLAAKTGCALPNDDTPDVEIEDSGTSDATS